MLPDYSDRQKAAPKKLVAKTGAKKRFANAKAQPCRQMTVERAKKYAGSSKDEQKIDIVAFVRTLR